jgi:predicted RNA-binding protein associated with RNAse of E/G family
LRRGDPRNAGVCAGARRVGSSATRPGICDIRAGGCLLRALLYADRWYNVFELRSATGTLKGWYCNVTRPAIISAETIISEDLDLDLFVSADRDRMVRLDVEEFEARGLAQRDPHVYAAACAALEELERLASAGAPPFCV